jgi:exodeoxyribonuclease VII small subunit
MRLEHPVANPNILSQRRWRRFIIAPYLPLLETYMAAKKKEKPIDFEQSLAALEDLVHKMEQGDLTLEESLHAFTTGIKLTRDCQTRLAEAEQQVRILQEQQGQISLDEFDADDDQ